MYTSLINTWEFLKGIAYVVLLLDLVLKCIAPTKHSIASLSQILIRSGIRTSETDLWISIIFAFLGGFLFGLFELPKSEFDTSFTICFITGTFWCILLGAFFVLTVGVKHLWIGAVLILIIACSVYFK